MAFRVEYRSRLSHARPRARRRLCVRRTPSRIRALASRLGPPQGGIMSRRVGPTRPIAVLLPLVALIAASCAKKQETAENAPPPAESTHAAPAMTDANIAAIVLAADSIDIENGKTAKTKTKNAQV